MRTLLSDLVQVHYRQLYVESRPAPDDQILDPTACFEGRPSGSCGAAVPGLLYLTTGLHSGQVGFSIELHERPPPVNDGWEEIVEVSFTPASPRIALVGWGGGWAHPLDLDQVDHRVRYCGVGIEEARAADTHLDDEPLDWYLLRFWPAPPQPDRVLKRSR